MTTKDSGGPAFPTENYDNMMRDRAVGFTGMTLRDWFAGENAAAIIGGLTASQTNTAAEHAALIARSAYQLADAMIAERAK